MNKTRILLTISLVFFLVSASNATNIFYVDVNGPNDPGSGTFEEPFLRIKDAIDIAQDSDVIEIRPGIYTGEGNYNLDPHGKSITIRSTDPDDAGIIANTIIDPNHNGRGFYLHSNENADCIISGLTIRNSDSIISSNGAGIYCYSSSPTIRNCIIQNGHANDSGGGIACHYSNAIIINCKITGNVSDYYGGGIGCSFSTPLITGCIISGNTAGFEGGGIDNGLSDSNIINCLIIDNNAPLGGGINCYSPGLSSVVNCTLVANSAGYAGGGVYCWSQGSAVIENSILWANTTDYGGPQLALLEDGNALVSYCNVQGGKIDVNDPCGQLVWGSGNINTDPCFAALDPNGDPNLWDLHLQSEYGRWDPNSQGWVTDSNTSLCIDAGDPNSDWSGELWPNGKRINMGAYGGTDKASKNGNPADFDINWTVNFKDFALLADKWMVEGNYIEDLSSNGIIDSADLHLFTDNWLWQKE